MRMSQPLAAASGLATLTVALKAGAASAHVTANPGSGGQEPEHPAPTIHLVSAKAVSAQVNAGRPTKASASSDDGTARLLGTLGLVAGIIGIAVGGYGLSRKRTA
jgi:hypothetical protein